MNVTKEDILSAIQKSTELELNPQNNRVRRLGNKPLPEFKFLNKKTERRDEKESDEIDQECEQSFDPVILEISSDKEPEFRWKLIQDEYRSLNPNLNVVYLRFNKNHGHIGLFINEGKDSNFIESFELQGIKLSVKKCEGDQLIDFWKDHGGHFELCIGKKKGDKNDKKGRKNKNKKDPNQLKTSVVLGGETFTDLIKIKSRARRIITSTKDGDKIGSSDQEFLTDVLKYHSNFDVKGKDISHFTTGKPRDYDYSRCFYIVRNDNTSEDFSVHKCIERIGIENNKKKRD